MSDGDVPKLLRPWYRPDLGTSAVTEAVSGCLQGDYLIRQSSRTTGFVLVVNDRGTPVNFSIRVNHNTGEIAFAGQDFDSLDELHEFLLENPLKGLSDDKLDMGSPAIVAPWFVGATDRVTGEDLVKKANHGDFLVRLSSKRDKFNLVVNDCGHVCTFSILRKNRNSFTFGHGTFSSVADLIATMRQSHFRSEISRHLTLNKSAI
eukprot:m.41568 g.41568  ORF g.41568 m.41568 type:complete len:205 (-) comp9782_c0_seq2:115-729(-)